VKRVPLLAALALVALGCADAGPGRTLRGNGLTLSMPPGWHGLAGPGGFQAADFPLPRRARSSANLVRVTRGHVHLIVWNYGPWDEYRPHVRATPTPLVLGRRNLTGGFEGFGADDAYLARTATVRGEMLGILADLGPRPLTRSALRRANDVLATLRVLPPRVLRPRHGRLASDGVSVRLLPGWSGRLEIPAEHYGARLVVRAAHDDVHLELLEVDLTDPPPHRDLPLTVSSRDAFRRGSLLYVHRAFSTGGRSFDLSVAAPAAGDLREANRFLATLNVLPRPWTFRSCDLSFRLPGTWHVGIRPRSGCYPVLKLHGPRILVVLSELRSGERASGRILRRAGRRFRVEVTPASARARTAVVLATFRARPRS
jgi:hypothetical protein